MKQLFVIFTSTGLYSYIGTHSDLLQHSVALAKTHLQVDVSYAKRLVIYGGNLIQWHSIVPGERIPNVDDDFPEFVMGTSH